MSTIGERRHARPPERDRAPAGDRGRRPGLGRRAGFAAAALAFGATMLGTTIPTPLYDLYRQRFGFSELMITVIFATYAVGVIAALTLFGRLSDEIGRRPLLLAGMALSALSAGAFLAVDGLALLLVGRLLSGLSAGIFTGSATATLVDLAPPSGHARATLIAAVVNMGGLGLGPLVAGVLAQWAPAPLRLPFWVDLGLLAPALLGVCLMPEPVRRASRPRWRPQSVQVPAAMRGTFIRAAIAGFAGFAVLGLFTAVAPAFLGEILSITNRASIGAVVFCVFASSLLGQLALELIDQDRALGVGCAGLIAGMALLAAGIASSSLALFACGAVVAGLGQGLSFRAALGQINACAPSQQRGQVASSFFVLAYLAISLPVIGEGALSQLWGLRPAGLTFVAIVALLCAVAIALLALQPGDAAQRQDASRGR